MVSSKAKSTKGSKTSKKTSRIKIKRELIIPDAWIDELANLEINDDKWKCSVAMIEEQSPDATVYIEHFNESAINGTRLAVKAISKLEVMNTVTKNMVESNPGKEITPLALLSSEIYKSVGREFEKKIPTSLLAPLIKYIILDYKVLNKRVREGIKERHKEFEEYQKSLWQPSKAKSASGKDTKSSKLEGKSNKSAKTMKGKSSGYKGFTKLRRRGEEWKDVMWIDDAPIDGPQLYITVSTFFDADLPLELLSLNVPLNAVIKLNLLKTVSGVIGMMPTVPSDLQAIFQPLNEFKRMSTPYLSSNVRKRVNEQILIANKKIQILSFWDKITVLKNRAPSALLFKDIMFLHFIPEYSDFEYQIEAFQAEIYKQISHFLYDIFEITKRHKEYLKEIKLTNVLDSDICDLSSMHIYNSVLDSIPHEVLTIPFLVDAVVSQVCSLDSSILLGQNAERNVVEKISEQSINGAYESLLKLLDDLNVKYDLFHDVSNLSTDAESNGSAVALGSSTGITKVLTYSDDIDIKTFHLEKDVARFITNRTNYILQTAWTALLNRFFVYSHSNDNFIKLCNEIIKTEEDTGQYGLHYYIYLLIINSVVNSLVLLDSVDSSCRMNNSKENLVRYNREDLCEDCLLEVGSELICFSDSYLKNSLSSYDCCCDSSSTHKLSSEIIADNLFYIEDMTSDILLQRIQAVYPEFNQLETRYCPFTDQAVLIFHNLLFPRVLAFVDDWVGKLTTHVPIRDFVDYILEEEHVWLNKSEFESDLECSVSSNTANLLLTVRSRLSTLFPDMQFISYRSLKYESLMKQQKQQKTTPTTSNKKSKSLSGKMKLGSSKKSKGDIKKKGSKETRKEKKSLFNMLKSESIIPDETQKQHFEFSGYDLGEPMRFQFTGCKMEKILEDSCRITLNRMEKLYGEEWRTVNVINCGHSLYYNCKSYSETTSHSPFHLILSSGIVLYFGFPDYKRKPVAKLPSLISQFSNTRQSLKAHSILNTRYRTDSQDNPRKSLESKVKFIDSDLKSEGFRNSSFFPLDIKEANYFEIPSTYTLKMSTPSGLYVELVQENELLYIRQQLLSKGPLSRSVQQENFRCCLSSGHVIKFMLSGFIEVLGSNGAIYTIYEVNDKLFDKNNPGSGELDGGKNTKNVTSESSVKENTKTSQKDEMSKNKKNLKSHKKSTDSNKQNVPTDEGEPRLNSSLDTVHYELTTSDGRRYLIQNTFTKALNTVLMISSTDVGNDCINDERLDGVTTKHLPNGVLEVNFPDNSRITSIPVESDEELFSEWSSEELDQWFAGSIQIQPTTVALDPIKSSLETSVREDMNAILTSVLQVSLSKDHTERVTDDHTSLRLSTDQSARFSKSLHASCSKDSKTSFSKDYNNGGLPNSCNTSSLFRNQKPRYSDDGFIVFNVSYLMEHPNYSSVYFDASNCEVELKLPFCTSITLKSDGSFKAFFDGATLTVNDDDIYFNRTNENGGVIRTTVINTSGPSKKSTGDFSEDEVGKESLTGSTDEFAYKFLMQKMDSESGMNTEKVWVLLYSVDKLGNEIFVDYDLNMHELPITRECIRIKGSDFSCFVINRDMSGFRLVSDDEANQHIQSVNEGHGLIRKSDNTWSSLFTSLAVAHNESEKWLMEYKEITFKKTKKKSRISTYGRRESWIQPFVEKETTDNVSISDVVIVRLLHRIPTQDSVLNNLNTALDGFRKGSMCAQPIRITSMLKKVDLDLAEITINPTLLRQIYNEEKIKTGKEMDKFRTNMKSNFIYSLVRQACIRARKVRQKKKEEEFKTALRNREIPPYHLSCFGQVHNILDEVLSNVHDLRKTPSSTSNVYERVNNIIDEILSLACRTKSVGTVSEIMNDLISNVCEIENERVSSIVDEIFRNVCNLTKVRSRQDFLNAILEKPLHLITPEEVEILCRMFESGSGDSPIFVNEDFILQDILDARHQISHYFKNLRELLAFYRGVQKDNISLDKNIC